MSKAALAKFVEQENFFARIYKDDVYDVNNLTDKQVEALCQKIDGSLSPENLTCDGELTDAEVTAKYRMLTGAGHELLKIADMRGLKITIYELYQE